MKPRLILTAKVKPRLLLTPKVHSPKSPGGSQFIPAGVSGYKYAKPAKPRTPSVIKKKLS